MRWLVALLVVLGAMPVQAGRTRFARIYIDGAGECEGSTARDFHYAMSVREVHVGDCIRLPATILSDFTLCCPGTDNCVNYTVPCEEPPQCVTSYDY